MGYRVIKFFTDLQDKGHPYNVGDPFPRAGLAVSEERIKELAGSRNKQKTPLIEEVYDRFRMEPKYEPEPVKEPEKPEAKPRRLSKRQRQRNDE